jgi:hypothetical protein
MPIELPNLDDRSFTDLVEEARELLVSNAPALTDHNPSDPAITLIEVFAYFTDVLLFRANNVTDTNRINFLKLLNGPAWPPGPPDELNLDDPAVLDAEIRRTVLELRSMDRAVTDEDFEDLARAADPGVARAQCLPERNLELTDPTQRAQLQAGHISVVIVPSVSASLAVLRTTVAAYLDPRRLLTTQVHVVGPRFVPVQVQVTLRLTQDAVADDVKARAIAALQTFLDPIVGRDGTGWPFGRNVYVSEIYRLLDALPGVDFVRRRIDTTSGHELDEFATTPAFASRLLRNSANELISIALDPDELISLQVTATKTDQDPDLEIEAAPPIAL